LTDLQEYSDSEFDFEDSKEINARLAEEFLRSISPTFRNAARELEMDKICIAHLQLAHTSPGKQAIVRELLPKSDPILIDRSLTEIREMRRYLIAGEAPRFFGLTDIAPTLRKVEIEGSTLIIEEGFRLLGAMKAMRMMREFFSRRHDEAPLLWKTAINLFDDKILELHFDTVFDDAGKIRDSASPELSRIRHDMVRAADNLRNRLMAIVRRLSEDEFARDEIIT
jgi:DNA mismatch repair protein MutS2